MARATALLAGVTLLMALVVGLAVAHPTGREVQRWSGATRFDTAAAVSAGAFSPRAASRVWIASGEAFPDALAAGPAAVADGGPVLTTARESLPGAVRDELARLRPSRVMVVGGPAAVSESVLDAVEAALPGVESERVWGTDRFATAAAVAGAGFPEGAMTVYVATGASFADALAAVPAAGADGAALLLVTRDRVPAPTREALEALRPAQVVVVGGTAAVSPAVAEDLRTITGAQVDRAAGADRFATAAALLDRTGPTPRGELLVASGETFADALAGGPAAAAMNTGILLTGRSALPQSTATAIEALDPASVTILGGKSAVSVRVEEAIATVASPCAQASAALGEGYLEAAEAAYSALAERQAPPPCATDGLAMVRHQRAAAMAHFARGRAAEREAARGPRADRSDKLKEAIDHYQAALEADRSSAASERLDALQQPAARVRRWVDEFVELVAAPLERPVQALLIGMLALWLLTRIATATLRRPWPMGGRPLLLTWVSAVTITAIALALLMQRDAAPWGPWQLIAAVVLLAVVVGLLAMASLRRVRLKEIEAADELKELKYAVHAQLHALIHEPATSLDIVGGIDDDKWIGTVLTSFAGTHWVVTALSNAVKAIPPAPSYTVAATAPAGAQGKISLTLKRGRRFVDTVVLGPPPATGSDPPEGTTKNDDAIDERAVTASAWLLVRISADARRPMPGLYGATSYESLAKQLIAAQRVAKGNLDGARKLLGEAVDLDSSNLGAQFSRIELDLRVSDQVEADDRRVQAHGEAHEGLDKLLRLACEQDRSRNPLQLRILYARAAASVHLGLLCEGLGQRSLEAFKRARAEAKKLARHVDDGKARWPRQRTSTRNFAQRMAVSAAIAERIAALHYDLCSRGEERLTENDKKLAVALRSAPLGPRDEYNLACYYAIRPDAVTGTGQTRGDVALRYLESSVRREALRAFAADDPCLRSLRTRRFKRRFAEIVRAKEIAPTETGRPCCLTGAVQWLRGLAPCPRRWRRASGRGGPATAGAASPGSPSRAAGCSRTGSPARSSTGG